MVFGLEEPSQPEDGGPDKEGLKILLGFLYFAKLSFSEVDDHFLFFLYSAIASARRCSQPALSSKNLL